MNTQNRAEHLPDPMLTLAAADILGAATSDDARLLHAVFVRVAGREGAVTATLFQRVVCLAGRLLPLDTIGLLPRDSVFSDLREHALLRALARDHVEGVDVPRALRPSLALTATAWADTGGHPLTLDTDEMEALAEAIDVCLQLVEEVARRGGRTARELSDSLERVAVKEALTAIAADYGSRPTSA